MIEKRLKNDLAKKRWRRFKKKRTAVYATWLFLALILMSATAELWANRKPLVLSYNGEIYFPVFKYYHPTVFGADFALMDYKELQLKDSDWALWPPIRWGPYERNANADTYPSPPTADNLMGTDEGGRDVAARLIYGFRYSFIYAFSVWGMVSIIGIIIGGFMGFKGGWVDLIGQRVIEIIESLPYLMILITLVSIFKPNIFLLSLLTVVFGWVGVSVYTRAEFLKLRRREFIEAARALGASQSRQIFKHLLPNSLTPLITLSPFLIAANVYGLASLDFLGFGLPPPTPSWGEMLNQANKNFQIAWWLAVYPSLALFVTLVLLNAIGEAVRDVFDPRHN